ncbi:MAG: transposase, partial [Synechococcaceae cyanobacterium]|nr:transposase [Synechococcaceae cyanobacterium]
MVLPSTFLDLFERAALKALLSNAGTRRRPDPGGCSACLTLVFHLAVEQGADPLLTVKNHQWRLDQQIVSQFRGHQPQSVAAPLRQRWAIENQCHWSRDTQLGADAHRYAQRNRVQVLAPLRTLALNLLRCNGFRA